MDRELVVEAVLVVEMMALGILRSHFAPHNHLDFHKMDNQHLDMELVRLLDMGYHLQRIAERDQHSRPRTEHLDRLHRFPIPKQGI